MSMFAKYLWREEQTGKRPNIFSELENISCKHVKEQFVLVIVNQLISRKSSAGCVIYSFSEIIIRYISLNCN